MSELSINDVYLVMVFVSCALSIYSAYRTHNKESQVNGVDEGIMTTDMNYIKESLEKIEKSVSNLDDKMESKYTSIESDFRQLLISNTKLSESYKSLHKRVDELSLKINGINE